VVDPAILDGWRRDGWARLGRVLDDGDLATLRARAEALMREEAPGLFYQHDAPSGEYRDLELGRGWIGPSSAYRKIERLERDAVVWRWIANPFFVAVARAAIGSELSLYRAMLMNKAAGGGTELPWHQDGGLFWGLDRDPIVSIWTALDDATAESGALEIVPGSHLAGLTRPIGGNVPAALVAREERRAIRVEAAAGEALLLHNHVWHRSGRNRTPAPRRALSFCYMHAETRCTRTRRAPRTFVRVA
jgi:ectoine hydroxylase-related dioxygenase (phytanoyl-CoA dioxygenase family)